MGGKAQKFKIVFTYETLEKLVSKELRTNMADANARSRTKNLFTIYYSHLRRRDLSWLLKGIQNSASYHALSAVPPQNL